MPRRTIPLWVAISVTLVIAGIVAVVKLRSAAVTLTGVVLRQDADPRKQLPIPGVKITATEAERNLEGVSDASGLFQLKLPNRGWREQPVLLAFRHPDYQLLEITPPVNGELNVVRMTPIPERVIPAGSHEVAIKDVRVRYAEKTSIGTNVGSAAKTFTVSNVGNVPCARQAPCSPDGKWKASAGGITMDAGDGQEFKNARVSCIAGPCPFTKIETGAIPTPGRIITVRVIDWSDTVTFLVEAEVSRDLPSDAIRQAYPAIYGRSMSFTLPASAQGPSIEADYGGAEIVFPLGPEIRLSWADCSLQVAPDQTKLYVCDLKPGYEFR